MSRPDFKEPQTTSDLNLVSDFLEMSKEDVYEFLSNQSNDSLSVTQNYLKLLLGAELDLKGCLKTNNRIVLKVNA